MNLPELHLDLEYEQYTSRSGLQTEVDKGKTGYLIVKRAMDIFGAIIGLMLSFPFLLVIAMLNKWEDWKAPVFYRQVRVGKNGKPFTMYKLRSMVVNAEDQLDNLRHLNEVDGAMFKIRNDPRVTKVGKFIRRTSIDELPQFWNVLRGEMSLVGPRPPLPTEVEEYSSYDKQRLLVTPGCTGLWQVSARNSVGFKEMVELDIRYIKMRNLKMDFSIIFRTMFVIVRSKDAY